MSVKTMKPLVINGKIIPVPIIQGGMGVGVSLSSLATAAIKEGLVGTISSAQVGFKEPDFSRGPKQALEANVRALKKEIKKVREKVDGFLAVNVLTASRHYQEAIKACVEMKVDAIVSGAGLPLELPKHAAKKGIALIPIISSAKALRVICNYWKKKYDCLPDAVIVEGPDAGGHLGITYADLASEEKMSQIKSLEERFLEVKAFKEKEGYEFPLIVAGGVYTGYDIKYYMNLGADAVQMGTRFIATEECDAHEDFKTYFIQASEEDVVYVKSPVGYPGRALRTEFTEKTELGNIPVEKCLACVIPCKGKHPSTVYCITEHLVKSVTGDIQNGLVFSGANAHRIDRIYKVKELVDELKSQYEEE